MSDVLGGLSPSLLISALVVASVPILLAARGELVVERAGVLNLGVEGMMIVGAVIGFMAAVESQSPVIGFVCGALGGMMMALLFGLITQVLLANQVATGLALSLFGIGLSSLLGQSYVGIKPPHTVALDWGPLSELPLLGRVLFGYDWVVYLSLFLTLAVWWGLRATRTGLVLRAVGENHDAAHALGYRVVLIRLGALAFGGALAGMGGAYISLVRVPQWANGITAGVGWIALAIVVFSAWRPFWLLVGAYLFGGISVLQFNVQAAGIALPVEYLSSAPYLITIIALVVMSSGKGKAALNAPACLGQNFYASR